MLLHLHKQVSGLCLHRLTGLDKTFGFPTETRSQSWGHGSEAKPRAREGPGPGFNPQGSINEQAMR